jgi:ERCC4-related helicase
LQVHDVFLSILDSSYFSMRQVNLLILDECHHAQGKAPYKQIMDRYHDQKKNGGRVPRILGLSASIVAKKCTLAKFIEEKSKLERNLDAKVITTENLANLIQHVTMPDERFEEYDNSADSLACPADDLGKIGNAGVQELSARMEMEIKRLPAMEMVASALHKKKIEEAMNKAKKILVNLLLTLGDLGNGFF